MVQKMGAGGARDPPHFADLIITGTVYKSIYAL